MDAYIIEIDTDKPLGIEKTAEKQGLKTLSDIKIIDEDKNDSCEMYKLGCKIAHLH